MVYFLASSSPSASCPSILTCIFCKYSLSWRQVAVSVHMIRIVPLESSLNIGLKYKSLSISSSTSARSAHFGCSSSTGCRVSRDAPSPDGLSSVLPVYTRRFSCIENGMCRIKKQPRRLILPCRTWRWRMCS